MSKLINPSSTKARSSATGQTPEFQLLKRWIPRIYTSLKNGGGIPASFFRKFSSNKCTQEYVYERFLKNLDADPRKVLGRITRQAIENIPAKRKRLFKEVDHLSNSQFYYIILYYFLLRQFYEPEAMALIEKVSSKQIVPHPIKKLRQQIGRSFSRAIRAIPRTDEKLINKVVGLENSLLSQFDSELAHLVPKPLTLYDVINEIDHIYSTYPDNQSKRENEFLKLQERMFNCTLPVKPAHRPGDLIANQLIILTRKYFKTAGLSMYRANDLIAQTINYCFFPEEELKRDHVRLRYKDQWTSIGRKD